MTLGRLSGSRPRWQSQLIFKDEGDQTRFKRLRVGKWMGRIRSVPLSRCTPVRISAGE
jgi:hypothetical protein